jgi:phospholipid/cholesterol/gamma-HCH transport system substrate-binding protein
MEAEARYTYVGAAVLALIAALVFALVWLKNTGGRDRYSRYAVYFEQQALDGLEIGGEVNLRGIKVGRVEDYALVGGKLNRVRVEVRVDRRTPVFTNTVAVVTRNFVTGIAAITLVTREPAGEPLTQVAEGDSYPVIGEGHSDLDEIAGRVSQVGVLATDALHSISQLLTPENRRAAADAIAQWRDLGAGLNRRLGAIDRTLAQTGTAAASFAESAARLGQAGERLATVAEQTGSRLDTTLGEAELALRDARAALARVAASVESLERQARGTAHRLEATAASADDQLSAAVAELRLSLEAATRVVENLRDPRAALVGPGRAQLGPGERKP